MNNFPETVLSKSYKALTAMNKIKLANVVLDNGVGRFDANYRAMTVIMNFALTKKSDITQMSLDNIFDQMVIATHSSDRFFRSTVIHRPKLQGERRVSYIGSERMHKVEWFHSTVNGQLNMYDGNIWGYGSGDYAHDAQTIIARLHISSNRDEVNREFYMNLADSKRSMISTKTKASVDNVYSILGSNSLRPFFPITQ